MISTELLYALAGVGLFAIGLRATLLHHLLLPRLLALNVCGAGVFLIFIAIAYAGIEGMPDPVPHALVLTGIVVAVSATAMALALGRRLEAIKSEDMKSEALKSAATKSKAVNDE
jgi:multicomponent Na+:H+ antiporter subunit C